MLATDSNSDDIAPDIVSAAANVVADSRLLSNDSDDAGSSYAVQDDVVAMAENVPVGGVAAVAFGLHWFALDVAALVDCRQ